MELLNLKTDEESSTNFARVDMVVVILANVINIVMAGLFAARISSLHQIQYILGVAALVMGFALGCVAFLNGKWNRDKWMTLLLVPIFLFFIVEFVLDYALALDFRSTILVGPYILLYYVGLWGLIGYSFKVNKKAGFVTLTTYFANMVLSILPYI